MTLGLFLSVPLLAENTGNTFFILSSYSLVSTLIVGLVTSFLVLNIARRMSGGLIGHALKYFSGGMFFVLAGFIIEQATLFEKFSEYNASLAETAHDILFIVGFIIMAFAAQKLSKAIGMNK